MPLALVFAFVCKWGIMGLWAGFTIACVILDIGLFVIIYAPDWYKISEQVKEALKANQHNATNAVSYYRANMTPGGQRKSPFFELGQQRVYTILQHNRRLLDTPLKDKKAVADDENRVAHFGKQDNAA